MTIGRHLLTLAAGLPLLLAGCTEDPSPQIAPPEPTASTSLPSPQPKEPWQKKSKAGAVAFAEHWVEVFNEAVADGDPGELLALSRPSCETCSNFASVIRDVTRDGGSIDSKGWRIDAFSFAGDRVGKRASLSLQIHQPSEIVTRPGSEKEVTTGGKVTYQADLTWRRAAWAMSRLTLIAD